MAKKFSSPGAENTGLAKQNYHCLLLLNVTELSWNQPLQIAESLDLQ